MRRKISLKARKAYFENLDKMRREAVASVHVPIKLLTDKERKRHTTVEALMQDGKSPYNAGEISALPVGKSEPKDKPFVKDMPIKGRLKTGVLFRVDSNIFKDLGLELVEGGIPEVKCSFCDTTLDGVHSTEGKGPLRRSIENEPIFNQNGEIIDFKEKIKFTSSDIRACDACCLSLAPRTYIDRDGIQRDTPNKTVFGEFD